MGWRKTARSLFPGLQNLWRPSLIRPLTLLRIVVVFLALGAGPFALSGSAGPETAGSPTSVQLKRKIAAERNRLARLKDRLDSQKRRIVRSKRAERSVLEAIEGFDAQLEILGGELRIRNYHLALARRRLDASERKRRDLEVRMAKAEAELRRRIRSLYKGMGAPPSLLAWLNSGVAEAARMRIYADRIARADAGLIRYVQQERKARARLLEVIRSETRALAAGKREVEKEEKRLRAARAKKARLLASIRKRRDRQRQAYSEVRRAARRLQGLLKRWAAKAKQRHRWSFEDRKGMLPWPVSGKILSRFDPVRRTASSTLTFKTGITLAAKRGEPVRAVGGGKVMYADRLRGYGNLLVLAHGKSLYTVYAHATIATVRVGDRVEEGQPIARVGEGGPLGRPAIYFEVRHLGKPQDPLRWLRVRTP